MARFVERIKNDLVLQTALLAAALLLVCIAYRLTLHNTYTGYIPTHLEEEENRELQITQESDDGPALHVASREDHDGFVELKIRPQEPGPGSAFLDITGKDAGKDAGDPSYMGAYKVGRFMTVYDMSTGGFTGDKIVLIANTLFWIGLGFLMARQYARLKGSGFYSYKAIYTAGFSIFALAAGFQMLVVTVRHLYDPQGFPMMEAYGTIHSMSYNFILMTVPFLLVFTVSMIVSNAELLRHERRRPQNLLGIAAGLFIILGVLFAIMLYSRNFSGSEFGHRIHQTVQGVYATFFAYFECMLFGAIICGLKAARHEPAPDKDYVIILGCRFRKDGTLTPLLQGRVDRAVAFGNDQKKRTGKDIIYVPSGGQGNDEQIPESEAMARYLLSRGVTKEAIMQENASRNTYENMAFSKKLIREKAPDAKVIFSTTNYHVFRSGVWASFAGLEAEGIGSRTKWWFWPNAFLRECVGLLVRRWKQELLLLVCMTVFFASLTMLL